MESTSRFDRFEILAPLGAGGMGEVVKARALGPHGFEKSVAIKRIRAEWAAQEAMAERFIREARIAARLQHANIVQVFDFGRHDDELFIVMELVDGQSLDDILARLAEAGRRPTVAQTLQIALDVARALDAAHTLTDEGGEGEGIIHRDVSPANILVSRKGVVKLTDFGIAAWASGQGRTSLVAGKPLYMAPEQLRGDALDGRADLFAVGVVIYEMLTGRRPWKGIVDAAPDATLEGMGYEPPSTWATGIPPALDALVARLLEPDAERRLGSARELAKELVQLSYRSQIVLDPSELSPLVGDRSEQATAPTLPQYVSKVETLVATGVSPDGVTLLKAGDGAAGEGEAGGETVEDEARPARLAPSRPERAAPAATPRSWLWGAAAVLLGLGAASAWVFAGPVDGRKARVADEAVASATGAEGRERGAGEAPSRRARVRGVRTAADEGASADGVATAAARGAASGPSAPGAAGEATAAAGLAAAAGPGSEAATGEATAAPEAGGLAAAGPRSEAATGEATAASEAGASAAAAGPGSEAAAGEAIAAGGEGAAPEASPAPAGSAGEAPAGGANAAREGASRGARPAAARGGSTLAAAGEGSAPRGGNAARGAGRDGAGRGASDGAGHGSGGEGAASPGERAERRGAAAEGGARGAGRRSPGASRAASAAAGETGTLDVFTRPWAQIFVDGRRMERNAPARGLEVPAGRRRVRLVNPVLGLEAERTVVVPAGGRARLQVFLDAADAPAD